MTVIPPPKRNKLRNILLNLHFFFPPEPGSKLKTGKEDDVGLMVKCLLKVKKDEVQL